ncbi:MAG: hypothetical protein KJ054_06715 [Gammaproteobacteria bacterium]|nr:hypothetical protein [Gammaproteobacteria bacterium]
MVTRQALLIGGLVLLLGAPVRPAPIEYAGLLDFVDVDLGGAVYSGRGIGTAFTGTIDDVTFSGSLSDGVIPTAFTCCIDADGMEFSDNVMVDAAIAARLNSWVGSGGAFAPGHLLDLIDIEGDALTASGGRIEIGLSYVLDPTAFSGSGAAAYPFDPADLYVAVFFIFEENALGEEIYSAMGNLEPVPLPPTLGLLVTGFLASLAVARRRGQRGCRCYGFGNLLSR